MIGKTFKKSAYAAAGVDRKLRNKSKKELAVLTKTYQYSQYGPVIRLPYGNVFPVSRTLYLDLIIEGVGTKVLLAQLADKYDTIGIDGVAVAVNDVIRSGARPLAIADNIHAHISDPCLIKEWMKGIVKGAKEAGCIVPSGEIGDVPDLIKGFVDRKAFDMVFASIGAVGNDSLIRGNHLKPGDVVIGMRSSGIHSNGISLVRKVLFRQWGGEYEPFDVPEGLDRGVAYETLEPTKIYVRPFIRVANNLRVKAAVHITGDGYLKFDKLTRLNKGIGFEFGNFKPQSIFSLVQKVSRKRRKTISDGEMFKTFNMGWGFAIVVDSASKDEAIDSLERGGVEASAIGKVTNSGRIVIRYKGKRVVLAR